MPWKGRLYKEVVILNSALHTYCVFESLWDLVEIETVIHRSGVRPQMSGKDLKETPIDFVFIRQDKGLDGKEAISFTKAIISRIESNNLEI